MGLLSKIVFNSLTSGGIISKPPTQRVVEKTVKTAVVETVNKTTTKNKDYAEYGDVIGVKRSGYKHFGVYINVKRSKLDNNNNGLVNNDSIDKSSLNPPIPETTTNISTDISNQSVNTIDKTIKHEGLREENTSKYNFLEKYRQVLDKCELNYIDNNYRGAVKQAIMFLLLETNNGGNVKIGNNYISGEKVRSDIDKIDASVIEHAICKFKEASYSQKIKSAISYLKTCIYNSLTEIKLDKDFKPSYDSVI